MDFEKMSPYDFLRRLFRDIKRILIDSVNIVIDIIGIIYSIVLLLVGFLRAFMRIKTPFKWLLPAGVVAIILLMVFVPKSCEEYVPLGIEVNPAKNEFAYKPRVNPPAKPHRLIGVKYAMFNDANDKHLAAAEKIGVDPLSSREALENLSRQLKETDDNRAYKVDNLTHSIPYLVPEANELLTEIGRSFQDSLVMKHLPPAKIIVTSVLRTLGDVKNLGRRNINASKNSAHCYGTTFDITYKRYYTMMGESMDNAGKYTAVLGEVLRDLRKKGRCYVKFERKQACFHITVRE